MGVGDSAHPQWRPMCNWCIHAFSFFLSLIGVSLANGIFIQELNYFENHCVFYSKNFGQGALKIQSLVTPQGLQILWYLCSCRKEMCSWTCFRFLQILQLMSGKSSSEVDVFNSSAGKPSDHSNCRTISLLPPSPFMWSTWDSNQHWLG